MLHLKDTGELLRSNIKQQSDRLEEDEQTGRDDEVSKEAKRTMASMQQRWNEWAAECDKICRASH